MGEKINTAIYCQLTNHRKAMAAKSVVLSALHALLQPRSQGLSSYRLGRARRDPGRVWSRASVTIENTREESSLNKEFVALNFVEFKAGLMASRCESAITRDVLQ